MRKQQPGHWAVITQTNAATMAQYEIRHNEEYGTISQYSTFFTKSAPSSFENWSNNGARRVTLESEYVLDFQRKAAFTRSTFSCENRHFAFFLS